MASCKERSTPTWTHRVLGGTIINIITGLIFFGLIGYGVYWVTKQTGQATDQYMTAMVNTQKNAKSLTCQMNLRSIGQTLQTYAISNEAFPASQEELVSFAGYGSKLFHCPDPNGGEYIYVPGPRLDASTPVIVVYESKPVHNGKCNVLFSDGQIVALTPEELQQALGAAPARRK
jgi:prepilin-type processing-associated H-X9-DG protein